MKNYRVKEISTNKNFNVSEDSLDDKFEVICEVDEDGNTPSEAQAFSEDAAIQSQNKINSANKY